MNKGWKTLAWVAGGVLAAAIWSTAAPTQAWAAETAALYVDGERSELQARSIGGTAYVSLETVAALGGAVKADRDGKTYTVSAGRKEVRFTVGEKQRFVDGVPVTGDETAELADAKVFVPAAWMTGTLGLKVVKDRFTDSIYIFKQKNDGTTLPSSLPSGATASTQEVVAAPGATPAGETPTGPTQGGPPSDASSQQPTIQTIALEGDALHIAATANVTPSVFVLKSPDRVVVDVPNATVVRDANGKASGSVAVDANHPYVAGIRYSLFATEPSTVRIVVDLKRPKPYSLKPAPNGAVLHFTQAEPVKVVIDAGHGGNDPGAISASGKYEKDITLPVALKVMQRLEAEKLIQTVMIRENDAYLSPAQRAAAANAAGADLFVSIHANTASSPAVKGTEMYYWREDSLAFAQRIHASLVQTIGSADRKVKQERFVVVRETSMPSVLLELGFITNADDEAKLYNEEMQNRIADAIVASIKAHFNIP